MFAKVAALTFVSALVGQAMGHGLVSSPPIRQPGDAFKANCGDQMFYNVNSDPAGNIQQLNQLKATSFSASSCNLNLCKGLQFADVSAANIQSWTVGQVVPIKVDIRAPHTGSANVSIIDTTTNTMIGSPLKTWDVYASVSAPITADQTSFSVTIPDLGGKCKTAGDCVLQWWWDAPSIDQTYESCVDFTLGGSGSGAPSTPSSAAASAPAATSAASQPVETSAPAATSAPETSAPAETSAVPEPTTTSAPTATVVPTTSAAPAATTAPSSCGGTLKARDVRSGQKWAQCGGIGFDGETSCNEGLTCRPYNKVNIISPFCGIMSLTTSGQYYSACE
ncbi:Lytic polysaccharide mono-oxygenase, cellulose-degrading, partial [Rhizoctonia solani]